MPTTMRSAVRLLLSTLVLCAATAATMAQDGQELTTVILVRHTEKVLGVDDPPLAPEGEERARRLAYVLGSVGADAIFSTPTRRTLSTARPLAEKLGLEIVETPYGENYVRDMVARVRERHAGGVVVIVGHSNTTPDLARAFGAEKVPDIPESDYDNLFVVTFAKSGETRFLNLRF